MALVAVKINWVIFRNCKFSNGTISYWKSNSLGFFALFFLNNWPLRSFKESFKTSCSVVRVSLLDRNKNITYKAQKKTTEKNT